MLLWVLTSARRVKFPVEKSQYFAHRSSGLLCNAERVIKFSATFHGTTRGGHHFDSDTPEAGINRLGLSREFDTMLLEYLIDICCNSETSDTKFALTLFPSTIRSHSFFHNTQVLFSNNIEAKGRILFILEVQNA